MNTGDKNRLSLSNIVKKCEKEVCDDKTFFFFTKENLELNYYIRKRRFKERRREKKIAGLSSGVQGEHAELRQVAS